MAVQVSAKKWVYLFSEGNAGMRDLLGGKGAGLAEMTNIGLPVPSGFTITTEACKAYNADDGLSNEIWEQILEALATLERDTRKKLGSAQNPLLVSVRSGAKFSMPGMMDTVLNLGLNEQTLQGILDLTGNERFAYDTYRRFIQMFGKIVLGVDGTEFDRSLESHKAMVGAKLDTDLTEKHLKDIVSLFQSLVKEKTGAGFPSDPLDQLELAIKAVFDSWSNKRAVDYRNFNNIPHDIGTAVNIVTMVFGNMGEGSGTGVAFTRDPSTGNKTLYGEYLFNAQGEDVVSGIRTPQKLSKLAQDMPKFYHQFADIAQRLEAHYQDVQDIEFTIGGGRLYILQTRSAKRSARAAVKTAVDMVKEGLITKKDALQRVEPAHIEQFLLPNFDEKAKARAIKEGRLLAKGLNASPGAASGKAVLDADRAQEMGLNGESVILVRPETNPDDVHGIIHARGVLTTRGGATSHAAVVARGLGKPCIAGCEDLEIDVEARSFSVDGKTTRENDEISIDGTTGEVFLGHISTIDIDFSQQGELVTLLEWASEIKRLGVWANADYPRDAERALRFGAEGIGLCRTEHMFFEEERLPIVRQMILAAAEATSLEDTLKAIEEEVKAAPPERQNETEKRLAEQRAKVDSSEAVRQYREALDSLLNFQINDFKGLLEVMQGKPVIIRLLDPPLHEFLPSYEELLVETTELRLRGDNPNALREKEALLHEVAALREVNPMLGLRGCRLGLLYPAINEMQVRAIIEATCDLAKDGIDARPEIMIPLVGHVNELKLIRQQLETVAKQVQQEKGVGVSYKFGTMIEVPRAALTADEIAQYAQFFSFGTNDLTQATYGYSRDDAEGKFLLQYVTRGILPDNPFQILDRDGVGKLMETAVKLGRETRPDLEVGICGEHGGDPSSIEFCHRLGLDYVSASPFRVPVARLAAAQAALTSVEREIVPIGHSRLH